jgi:hypothetical protein
MANSPELYASLEHTLLLCLCIVSYFVAMIIQVRDPSVTVTHSDWILGLISSSIWGTVAYFFALQWVNVGSRMFITILATLVSYRFMKFVSSKTFQETIINAFVQWLMNLIKGKAGNSQDDGTDR